VVTFEVRPEGSKESSYTSADTLKQKCAYCIGGAGGTSQWPEEWLEVGW
jgi:hypothetical protein